jgi:hypothetical protein
VAVGRFVAGAVVSVLPAFVLSVGLAALVRALRLDGVIRQAVTAQAGRAVVLATAVGAFSPLCSCTVIPVIGGLLLGGVPLAPVMSFWVASPTMDPEMFALTVALLGWPLALTRLAATLVLSLGAGYVTLALTRGGLLREDVLKRAPRPAPAAPRPALSLARPLPVIAGGSCCGASAAPPASGGLGFLGDRLRGVDWPAVGRDMVEQGWRLGRWLILAFVLEALIIRYVPQAALAGVLGAEGRFAVILAALVGVPLYLNNVSALPIVSGLLAQGMQPGAAIAFLIAGPVTTVPAMSAVWGIVRPRIFALYLGVALVGAVVLGWLAQLLLG